MAEEKKFPSEIIDLPSKGKCYPKEHPCSDGKIEVKYMTAREEDILTSQNLIKKGLVIDALLNSLILTKNVTCDDLIIGDKNAVMVAARILAYGAEYECEISVEDDGMCVVMGQDQDSIDIVVRLLDSYNLVPVPCEAYDAEVVRIMDFGAFVKIAPGKEGLVHISALQQKV